MVLTQQAEQRDILVTGATSTGPRRTWRRSGWCPAVLVLLAGAALLRCYDVPLLTSGTFAAYIAVGVTLPGTLIWRLTHRRPGTIPEDLAAGTAIGYAIEVLSYIPARAI